MTYPYAADPAQMQGYAQPQQQQYAAPPVPQAPAQQAPPQPPVPQPPAPQGFPQQQGGYPAQQGGYPVGPPQGYAAPPNPYGYPQQPGYPMAPPAPPAQQFAPPSLDSFFGQPSVGWGPSWQFNQQTPIGTTYAGVVARAITKADVEHQTGKAQFPGMPAPILTYADGRPKEVMKVPMLVQADQRFTEGRAVFYVQGSTRDELARAMQAAGAPEGPPEAGAVIQVSKASEYRNAFGTMSARLAITYQRPNGVAPAQPPAAAPAPAPQQVAPPPAPAPQVQAAPAPAPQAPAPQQAPQQAAPPAQPPAPGPAPTGLDPAQQQVLAGLLGQQQ